MRFYAFPEKRARKSHHQRKKEFARKKSTSGDSTAAVVYDFCVEVVEVHSGRRASGKLRLVRADTTLRYLAAGAGGERHFELGACQFGGRPFCSCGLRRSLRTLPMRSTCCGPIWPSVPNVSSLCRCPLCRIGSKRFRQSLISVSGLQCPSRGDRLWPGIRVLSVHSRGSK